MVNLPPDPPDQPDRRRGDGAWPRENRILDTDELLAVVLAFLGIGSILWWGLSRSQGWLADSSLLPRQGSDSSSLVQPEPAGQADSFEPRTFEPNQRPRPDRPPGVAGSPGWGSESSSSGVTAPAAPPPLVPAAPTTVPTPPSGEVTETTQPLTLVDVPVTHWAYPFIKPMFDQGYLPDFPESGFQPDQPLTRAELAALLSQAFGQAPGSHPDLAFGDVPSTYWAAPAIENAVTHGFMSGYPKDVFRPDQAVPRYEVLVALATGLGLTPPPAPDQTLQAFVDLDSLPAWARPKVAAATENALVVNYPNRDQLKPTQAATRAEIVAMIHQALVQQGKLPAVESPYEVP